MALLNYDIDFSKLVSQLLGFIHRTKKSDGSPSVKRISWLTAILKPIVNIHLDFIAFVTKTKYDIKWNGQTIILQNLLVERFGPGIYIVNNRLEFDGAFVGEGADNGFYIGEKNDTVNFIDVTYSVSGKNFTVFVPSAIVFTMSEMQALINQYKMYGTTYEIIII